MDEAEKRGQGLPAALRIFLASRSCMCRCEARRVESSDPITPPVMLMGHGRRRPWTLRQASWRWIYTGRTRPGEYLEPS